MRTFAAIVALTTAITLPRAHATPVELRVNGTLGAWNGSLAQSDALGREVNVRTLTSLGLGFAAGLEVGIVFVEYNFTWFLANHSLSFDPDPNAASNPDLREGPYFAPLGINAGLSIPIIPIEPYIGIESGSFGFSTGVTDLSGYAFKAGFNVELIRDLLGVRAEFRRLFAIYDDTGKLPDGMSARFDSFFVGLVMGKL